MRICLFNSTQKGSTGSIVKCLADSFIKEGHDVLCIFGKQELNWQNIPCLFTINGEFRSLLNKFESRFDGRDGFVNSSNTKRVLRKIHDFKPDVFHFHNLHGEWIDARLLVDFANTNNIPVFMTVHDCWIETGRCAYYSFFGCDKYKRKCGACPYRLNYPKVYLLDRSRHFYKIKRRTFSSVAAYFSPSYWLSKQIKDASISTPVRVVGNPYDKLTFYPKEKPQSNIKTIGFCSFVWNETKGLSMAQSIARHYLLKGYRVVFVGISSSNPILPKGAVGIEKTTNRFELAELYRSFDVFVNPTKQDIFSMVNMESMACGTPVVCARVGGAYELLTEEWARGIVENYSLSNFIERIEDVLLCKPTGIPSRLEGMEKDRFAKRTLNEYKNEIDARLLKRIRL